MSTILITGGTGLIGQALGKMLIGKGHAVILLSRRKGQSDHTPPSPDPDNERPGAGTLRLANWDPVNKFIDSESIRQADYIVHLAGAGVADKRWTAKRKKEIIASRTITGDLLVKALREVPNKVKAVISISAIGWYGGDPAIPNPHPFVENDPPDPGFLGEGCRLWEAAIAPVTSLGKRLVVFRAGIVLSNRGGALSEFLKPAKAGIAAILGSGRQIISWVHIDDLCRLFMEAMEKQEWQGVYNAVAPQPVDNRTFARELAARLKGRLFVPVYVPSFVLKIILGEMSVEVLKSATVSSDKVRRAGFQFIYPSITSAFSDLLPYHT
ncbi:MAG: TIGR01777 family oxidoreductase [Bacteroidota bacterium]|nr:TIGR01777 family oxidoreductase [Bacteroidota bacterium]MDP4216066.1 TIGR01777 family oxidoreductase [Bacteroidota bacterium]MDP4252453.1 TIGR01777 family oxidoreductase [Bacteroidota bacterium]MDP4256637.1 TIGR01777 family oxidoreductase [Bacteroidota bacterium]